MIDVTVEEAVDTLRQMEIFMEQESECRFTLSEIYPVGHKAALHRAVQAHIDEGYAFDLVRTIANLDYEFAVFVKNVKTEATEGHYFANPGVFAKSPSRARWVETVEKALLVAHENGIRDFMVIRRAVSAPESIARGNIIWQRDGGDDE